MFDRQMRGAYDKGALRVRPARVTEADALTAIALAAKAYWGYSVADLARWHSDLTVTPEQIHMGVTWVAEMGVEPVGFCRLDASATPPELADLWVHPNWMRSGVGKVLLQSAAREVLRRGCQELSVDADPNAQVFYTAMGARQITTVAAPTEQQPDRVRPQLVFDAGALRHLSD